MPPNSRPPQATANQRRRRATAQEQGTGLIGDYIAAMQLSQRQQQQRKTQLAQSAKQPTTIKLKANGKPMVKVK